MMIKWIFGLYCFFPIWGEAGHNDKQELEMIEKNLQILKERLHQNELKQMQQETEAQELFIADWNAYSQKLQEVKEEKKEEGPIQLQIEKLEQRKQQLIDSKES